jgi:hypothetical protein
MIATGSFRAPGPGPSRVLTKPKVRPSQLFSNSVLVLTLTIAPAEGAQVPRHRDPVRAVSCIIIHPPHSLSPRVPIRHVSRLQLRSLGEHARHHTPTDEAAEGTSNFVCPYTMSHSFGEPHSPTDEAVENWSGSKSDSNSAASFSKWSNPSDEERAHRRRLTLFSQLLAYGDTAGKNSDCTNLSDDKFGYPHPP